MLIGIEIIIDGRQHGIRHWPVVPRVGDLVVCRFDGEPENVEVLAVVWGRQDGTHDYNADPTICAIHCKRRDAAETQTP